jgi:hypothetical protein
MVEDRDLCFTRLLPQTQVEAALERHQVRYRQRLYTPLLTIWTFLYQVLAPDQSCRAAVVRLLAFLCVGGDGSGSAKTDPYCRARQRLHLLAYNLIRTLMAQAAVTAGVCPRDLSFKGTLQTLVVFAAAGWACPERRNELYAAVLRAVATHRVNNRPDRVEPRAVKRRPKKQVYMTEPRSIAKARLLNTT